MYQELIADPRHPNSKLLKDLLTRAPRVCLCIKPISEDNRLHWEGRQETLGEHILLSQLMDGEYSVTGVIFLCLL